MNKKVIALALVLVIAMSGAFAADLVVSTGTVTDVTATLKAVIGGFFHHGFVNPADSSEFNATLEITNAFAVDPVFTYGYETNTSTDFGIYMEVSDFEHDTETGVAIKIADVEIGGATAAPNSGVYTLLTSAVSGQSENVQIKIIPLKATGLDHLGANISSTLEYVNDNATPGGYTSTVTVSVATV
ncbi:hypothetical protein [uncultured Sphaerochaeta sp.]|uniref:hypothetical protein n=1 Tax=uncultured Sphaerochaeta sp. TaxID=886478 RepID=UPI002AA92286|nr:hypothetical protein [uncultured Sphaerochaeta sp.]